MANHKGGTIYVGVTSDLQKRVFEHRTGAAAGFTKRYNCKRIVSMEYAIARAKQLKGGSRAKKIALIEAVNPDWRDLF